ncbi:hypothetical protein P885DRAFT_72581 [Corynascus similis CBS 632.67]
MLKRDLKDTTEVEFGKAIGLSTVDKVKFRIPMLEGVTRATTLVTLTNQEETKKACEEGVVWRAQMLNCEPYWGALQATQCYKCWGALCPRCGAGVHGEGGRAGEAQFAEGNTRPGYGGAQTQSKSGVQQGSNNNKNNHYRGYGTSASRACLPWRRPMMASKKQEEGSGPGVDPPALP